jgi:hypothetical protein
MRGRTESLPPSFVFWGSLAGKSTLGRQARGHWQSWLLREFVASFEAEGSKAGMVQAVAADEVDNKKHQERTADHNRDGNLEAELKVASIGNSSDELRPQSAQELGHKHIDSNGSGMGALRRQVMQDRGHRTVIPGHEETGDEQGGENKPFFVGGNRQENKRSRTQKSSGDNENAAVGVLFL